MSSDRLGYKYKKNVKKNDYNKEAKYALNMNKNKPSFE